MPSQILPDEIARKVKNIIANDDVNGMNLLIAGGIVNAKTVCDEVTLLGIAVRYNSRRIMGLLEEIGWGMGVRCIDGENFQIAIRADKSLLAWGMNDYGQVGDGTTTHRYNPTKVLADVESIALGWTHSLAVDSYGILWGWGGNQYGQLGKGSSIDRHEPSFVLSRVRAVAAGGIHSLAIRDDGSVWSWGYNDSGQLGNNGISDNKSPMKVIAGVRDIAAGAYHSLAITDEGSALAWGNNRNGELGDGTTIDRYEPVLILERFGKVSHVAAGISHSLAIMNDGYLFTWGNNTFGQLGDGNIMDSTKPVPVLANVKKVSAFGNSSLAVRHDGTLWIWGEHTKTHTPKRILDKVHDAKMLAHGQIYIAREDGLFWPIH